MVIQLCLLVANSLEEIHDNIHDCVGGAGHMGDPAYAGLLTRFFSAVINYLTFVSSFRSHLLDASYKCAEIVQYKCHTTHRPQVDRLLAFWQTIHYDVWVTEERERMQTFTIPPNSVISAETGDSPPAETENIGLMTPTRLDAILERRGYLLEVC